MNCPSILATVPKVVPWMTIEAPMTGSPVSSLITPVIVLRLAFLSIGNIKHNCFPLTHNAYLPGYKSLKVLALKVLCLMLVSKVHCSSCIFVHDINSGLLFDQLRASFTLMFSLLIVTVLSADTFANTALNVQNMHISITKNLIFGGLATKLFQSSFLFIKLK